MTHGQYYFRFLKSKSQKRLESWVNTTIQSQCRDRSTCRRLSMLRSTNTVDVAMLEDGVKLQSKFMYWQTLTPSVNQHLLLVVNDPFLLQRQQELIALGLQSQFQEPLLHITVSRNYVSDQVPCQVPDFDLYLGKEVVYVNQNQRNT